jgi:hypothetical protein
MTNAIVDAPQPQPPPVGRHLRNHESFLVCPDKEPVRLTNINQRVSIQIFFNNFVRRKDDNDDDIRLRITNEELNNNNNDNNNYDNGNNHENNRINAYQNKLIKYNERNASKAAESDNNRGGEQIIKNILIKSNLYDEKNDQNDKNDDDDDNNKKIKIAEEEGKNNANVEHFINIYHWIVHSTSDVFALSEKQTESELHKQTGKEMIKK